MRILVRILEIKRQDDLARADSDKADKRRKHVDVEGKAAKDAQARKRLFRMKLNANKQRHEQQAGQQHARDLEGSPLTHKGDRAQQQNQRRHERAGTRADRT